MKKILIILFSLFCVGCQASDFRQKIYQREVDYVWGDIDYPTVTHIVKQLEKLGVSVLIHKNIDKSMKVKERQYRYEGKHNIGYLIDAYCLSFNEELRFHVVGENQIFLYLKKDKVSFDEAKKNFQS